MPRSPGSVEGCPGYARQAGNAPESSRVRSVTAQGAGESVGNGISTVRDASAPSATCVLAWPPQRAAAECTTAPSGRLGVTVSTPGVSVVIDRMIGAGAVRASSRAFRSSTRPVRVCWSRRGPGLVQKGSLPFREARTLEG